VKQGQGIMPGGPNDYIAYGEAWANVSNTPHREYKHFVHEGGISTPLIAHWPAGIPEAQYGKIEAQPGHLIDLMATCADVAGAKYPAEFNGQTIQPMEGMSLMSAFEGRSSDTRSIFWEHEGNSAVRIGRWKLVRQHGKAWELYDMVEDRTELHDRAAQHPDRVADMSRQYEAWAQRCGVLDREKVVALMRSQGVTRAFWEDE
jgi:arylsulfatase